MEKPQKLTNSSSSAKSKKNISFEFENAVTRLKYQPLIRYDFDMNTIEKWVELKCINAPKRRSYHSSFIHKDTFYIFGGVDLKEGRISDMSSINLNFAQSIQWANLAISGEVPESLSDHSGIVVQDSYYMYGGQNSLEEVTNNLYVLNLNNFSWQKKTFSHNSVLPLSSHTCCYSKETNSIVVFGGYSRGLYSNDIYFYNIETSVWTKYKNDVKPKPEGRVKHTANIINNYMYIYGGQNVDGLFLSDMWKFNLTEMIWEQIIYNNSSPDDIPVGKSGHSSIHYDEDNSLYIFGGKIGHAQERNDLWKFDLKEEKFQLIHDTLLEIETDSKPSESMKLKRSKFLTLILLEATFSKFVSTDTSVKLSDSRTNQLSSVKKINVQEKTNSKSNFEELVLGSPNTKKIKLSMIYRMENSTENMVKGKSMVFEKSSSSINMIDRIKKGVVPEPRDGHTAEFYKDNMMIIFGGDRNKFTFNDLYVFNF